MSQTLSLKVVRKLADLTQETIDYLVMREQFDPSYPWVDNDAVRDEDFTDEVVAKTVAFGIASTDGEILREIPLPASGDISEALRAAEKAIAGARVVFDVKIDGIDEE